jgi:general secretion pathway protein K
MTSTGPVSRSRQRGVAVVLAMGVTALATLAATALVVTQSTWTRVSELSADRVQAQLLLRAGVDWACAILGDDRRSGAVDHSGEPWALKLPPMPVDRGILAGHIEDQQGAFNLNNVVRDGKVVPAQLAYFRRLLAILELPANLADALADWLDADSEPQSRDGAEDAYYAALAPPYLAANRPLIDVAELALVRGFDAAVHARLRPFVTALPRRTPVNVNTVSPEVLAAIANGLNLDAARALVGQRRRGYFHDRADFLARLPAGATVSQDEIAVGSAYFMAAMRVTIGDAVAGGTALIAREDGKWPAVVWRKLP